MTTISQRESDPTVSTFKQTETQNFDFLDGLRGVAILLVVACHFVYYNPESGKFIRFIGEMFSVGSCGVTLFFCLSGFLVSLPFWKNKFSGKSSVIPSGYVQRRFFKVYPPLFLSLVLLTPTYIHSAKDLDYLWAALEWMIGLPLLFPVYGKLNPLMWTLIVEVQFYVALPFIMLAFRGVSTNKSIWIIPLLLIATGFSSRYGFAAYNIYQTMVPTLYIPPLSSLEMFAMGVLVAGLYYKGLNRQYAWLGNIGLLIAASMFPLIAWERVSHITGPFLDEINNSILKIGFGLTLLFVADVKCLPARLLSNPVLRWFGEISYEWYLFHQVIFMLIKHSFGPAKGNLSQYLFVLGASIATSLALSALVYKYFSLPILSYGRSLHKKAGVAKLSG